MVALEQAATSVELQEYKFPEKTVVLLGEEKEGIPAHLFPVSAFVLYCLGYGRV